MHSKLELGGPRNDLNIDPRSSGGVHSAPLFAVILNLITEGAVLKVPRGFRWGFHRSMEESMFRMEGGMG
eukprot:15473965-Alexandrium_andersonii.AAC.1